MHLSTIPRLSATGLSCVCVFLCVFCSCWSGEPVSQLAELLLCCPAASSWGKPQGKAFRDGFLHEALDEMSTPAPKKSATMQSSGK